MRAEKSLKLSQRKDWYKILRISKTTSMSEIKKAYKKLALQWHPDKNVDNREEEKAKFREIAAAYEIETTPLNQLPEIGKNKDQVISYYTSAAREKLGMNIIILVCEVEICVGMNDMCCLYIGGKRGGGYVDVNLNYW